MGYTTKEEAQMIALGISGISMLNSTYAQSKKTLPSYYADLKKKKFPIERGMKLSRDDLIRKKVIMDLMCQFEIIMSDFNKRFEIDFGKYFKTELDRLKFFEKNELLQLEENRIFISKTGQLLIRNIAMVFDRYLEDLPERFLFSKTI
jgi:oxygen-independent coproporphyrinogen-3 oxidase